LYICNFLLVFPNKISAIFRKFLDLISLEILKKHICELIYLEIVRGKYILYNIFVKKELKLYVVHENGIRIALQRLVKELDNFL